jgi:sortase A
VSPSRWDRPPPPRDWRWFVGGIGKVLIATGLLMFGFVGYQLWGTAIEYNQSQDDLAARFDGLMAATTTTSTATTVATSPPAAAATTSSPAATTPLPVASGDPLALLEIPSIGVKTYVVHGVQPSDLKHGPGHYPDTPWPGQLGNSAIAGHRTTYGQPFYRLDEVEPGDEVVVTTIQGRFVYRATGSEVISPSQSDVVATTDPTVARLTLTTCTPRYTASKRLIVFADLDPEASAAPQPPIVGEPTATGSSVPATAVPTAANNDNPVVATTAPATTVPPAVVAASAGSDSADAFAHGWFSDDAAFADVALWGLVLTAVSIGAWLLSRRVRRNWVGALAGIVPFVIALYFFFQNVNRLLPAAL